MGPPGNRRTAVEYRTLGRSGCAVSALALGTMTFGAETDEAGAHEQLGTCAAPSTRRCAGAASTTSTPTRCTRGTR